MTPSTTSYERGDVVLVPFVFTDASAIKRRPAVVVSSPDFHVSRSELVIAAVTSRVRKPLLVGDHRIAAWRAAGLAKPSTATGILWTVRATMPTRRLGRLSDTDMKGFERSLRRALAL